MCLVASACSAGSVDTTGQTERTTKSLTTSTTSTLAATSTTTSTTLAPTTTVVTAIATTRPEASGCVVETPSADVDTDFYAKQCTVFGIPVLSSAAVEDEAHRGAEAVIVGMMSTRPDLVAEMIDNGLRVGIIGVDQVTTDLPEYADLNTLFPETDWDTRIRGVGATLAIPMTSVGEENLLCLESDVYRGESVMVHEFAHSVRGLGIATSDRELDLRIENAYEAAMATGLWTDTYAADNSDEYWAEAVQSYFDTNLAADPADGIHGPIDTNAELAGYDPRLYGVIDSVFGESAWRYVCPP